MGKGLSKYLTLEGIWLDMAVHIYNPTLERMRKINIHLKPH